jgi:hypothetical protein
MLNDSPGTDWRRPFSLHTAQEARPSLHPDDLELAGAPIVLSREATHAVYDGLFQHALIRHLCGDLSAAAVLDQDVQRLLDTLVHGAWSRPCGHQLPSTAPHTSESSGRTRWPGHR